MLGSRNPWAVFEPLSIDTKCRQCTHTGLSHTERLATEKSFSACLRTEKAKSTVLLTAPRIKRAALSSFEVSSFYNELSECDVRYILLLAKKSDSLHSDSGTV